MSEPRLVVLKHNGKTPTLATCDRCHVKFFVPLRAIRNPEQAEIYLREKFATHECSGTLWQRAQEK